MAIFETCSSCQGKGTLRVISREAVSYTSLEFTWRFPFFHLVTRKFEDVFCVNEERTCDLCNGEGEVSILEFSNEELTRKIH